MKNERALKRLGENLKTARKAKGLTQEELGRKIGAPKERICEYETGRYEPGLLTAKRIARALGVSLDALTATEALAGSA